MDDCVLPPKGPNDHEGNYDWGSTFINFASERASAAPPRPAPGRQRRVFMHYLPWYSSATVYATLPRQGWCGNDGGAIDCSNPENKQYSSVGPLIGEYSQYTADVLSYHLLLAHAAGVDGFIVNLNPRFPEQLELVARLVEVVLAHQAGWPTWFKQKLILSYDDSQATTADEIRANMIVIKERWLGNSTAAEAFFVDAGASEKFPLLFWSEAAPELQHTLAQEVFGGIMSDGSRARGVLVLARNAVNFNFSQGNFEWVDPPIVSGAPVSPDASPDWGEAYKLDFDWRMLHQHDVGGEGGRRANPVAMSAVWPGFDDSRVPFSWNHGNPRLIPRNVAAGNTLEATFDHVLQHHRAGSDETMLDRSYLQVVTFNDWPEGTAIEPDNSSDPYGERP